MNERLGVPVMRVFICWSRDRSKAIAHALHDLLPQALPGLTRESIFISEEIDKGAEWFQAVRSGLASARAGIIVLTYENIGSPWMHFEAGALARTLAADPAIEPTMTQAAAAGFGEIHRSAQTRPDAGPIPPLSPGIPPGDDRQRKAIFPLLRGVQAGEVTGPLAAYQATTTTRADMERLVGALAKALDIELPSRDKDELRIPGDAWRTFEEALKSATAPLAKVIPNFESLFHRKTFEEAFQQCTSQDWLARYEATKLTYSRLKEHEALVRAACPAHERGLYQMLLSDLDVYAMAIEALLITTEDFPLGNDGDLRMDRGTQLACENRRLAIKSVSMRLLHPLDLPLTTAAVRFMAAGTDEERRSIVHRVEGRVRWHRERAYENAATQGRPEAERVALDELMSETTPERQDSSGPAGSQPEPMLQCARPARLMQFRASSWDLDRIFYYRLVYYFETSAFRWPSPANADPAPAGAERQTIAPPMEHDLFCAARDVEMECERYLARPKGASLMPLIYALDALQGLHPRKYRTDVVEAAVTSAIEVVKKDLGSLPDSEAGTTIARLLAKTW